MEQRYPLMLDGETAGELTVRPAGGWTLFDVRCRAAPGIIRVSVYGAGREGYLGVLAPEGDGLALHRRLSRSALRDFPEKIEFAGRAGQPCLQIQTAPETETAAEPAAPEPEKASAVEATAEEAPADAPCPEPASCPLPRIYDPDAAALPEPTKTPPEDAAAPPALEDVYWYASPDGALVSFDGAENLIALPAGDARIPAGGGGWPKTIEGRDYVVYRTRDGRLIR